MKHKFLFEEAIWVAKGVFVDEDGNESPVVGETKITHGEKYWSNDGWMRIQSEESIEFKNTYQIVPFEENADTTNWTSENPAIGKMIGQFVLIGDTIISLYRTENNLYVGTEYLKLEDDDFYVNRGVVMKDNRKISSWAVGLRKKA